MSRPNVLLIQADQLTPFALGTYGSNVARTPNIDRLAREGTVFDTCYCNSPLCTPSRMSMLTGRYVQHIGTWDNGTPLASDVPTMAHYFSAAGYRTCLSGKMHFIGPDQLHGYEERLTTDIFPATTTWTYRWEEEQTHGARHSPVGLETWPWQTEYDTRTQARALEWLRMNASESMSWVRKQQNSRKLDDLPFFLTVSFTLPHPPFRAPEEYWRRYETATIPLPSWPEGHIENEHVAVRWIRNYHQLNELPSNEEVLTARQAYFANVSFIDDRVGELIDCLEAIGQRDNTLIVFTSDHGEMLGEHGCWCKRVAYEWSSRVPLILNWPGGISPGRRSDAVTELVHLLPTLSDLCGLESPVNIDGRTMSPLLDGRLDGWRHEALCENYTEGVKSATCMLRQNQYKYVGVVGEDPALYDLERDPGEFTNFAGHPDYADIEQNLAASLAEYWDGPEIDQTIRANKEDRFRINAALATKRHPSWSYLPEREADESWIR